MGAEGCRMTASMLVAEGRGAGRVLVGTGRVLGGY